MAEEVVNDADRALFELRVDGTPVGSTHYRLEGNTITFTHTEIDPGRREGGLGGKLVRGALDHVRANTDYRLVAQCPFTRSWIEKHPDYQDLLSR